MKCCSSESPMRLGSHDEQMAGRYNQSNSFADSCWMDADCLLGLLGDRDCGGHPSHNCVGVSTAFCATAIGGARCLFRLPCSPDAGPHPIRLGCCSANPLGDAVAATLVVACASFLPAR